MHVSSALLESSRQTLAPPCVRIALLESSQRHEAPPLSPCAKTVLRTLTPRREAPRWPTAPAPPASWALRAAPARPARQARTRTSEAQPPRARPARSGSGRPRPAPTQTTAFSTELRLYKQEVHTRHRLRIGFKSCFLFLARHWSKHSVISTCSRARFASKPKCSNCRRSEMRVHVF